MIQVLKLGMKINMIFQTLIVNTIPFRIKYFETSEAFFFIFNIINTYSAIYYIAASSTPMGAPLTPT